MRSELAAEREHTKGLFVAERVHTKSLFAAEREHTRGLLVAEREHTQGLLETERGHTKQMIQDSANDVKQSIHNEFKSFWNDNLEPYLSAMHADIKDLKRETKTTRRIVDEHTQDIMGLRAAVPRRAA
jgi:hypothetical protein